MSPLSLCRHQQPLSSNLSVSPNPLALALSDLSQQLLLLPPHSSIGFSPLLPFPAVPLPFHTSALSHLLISVPHPSFPLFSFSATAEPPTHPLITTALFSVLVRLSAPHPFTIIIFATFCHSTATASSLSSKLPCCRLLPPLASPLPTTPAPCLRPYAAQPTAPNSSHRCRLSLVIPLCSAPVSLVHVNCLLTASQLPLTASPSSSSLSSPSKLMHASCT